MSNQILMMDNRQLVPRWHTSRKIFKHNYPQQFIAINNGQFQEDHWFKKSVEKWQNDPTILNALDVFVRLVQDDNRAHYLYGSIHEQLLQKYDDLPVSIKDLVLPKLKYLDNLDGYETDTKRIRLIINKLKNIVVKYPRDSMSWMDLGFYYSIIGEDEKAYRCVDIAKNIDPNHSFIARSYSRFLVHIGEPEKAVWFLSKRPNLNTNPLMLSAYTSISSAFDLGKSRIKKAISLVHDWKGDKFKISELAACIGTIEFGNGSVSKSKKHFKLALASPSENVIAHLQWLRHKHHLNIPNVPNSIESIEGEFNELYTSNKFKECRDKLMEMYTFQPYSSGPIADAGYLSIAALNDPEFVIDVSDKRIPYYHMDFYELNNLIVAKLLVKDLSGIDTQMKILSRRVNSDNLSMFATMKATLGMALMVRGAIKDGMKLYEETIELLKVRGMNRTLCIAKFFYSNQLIEINPEKSLQLKKESNELAKKYGVLEFIN